MLPVPLDVVLAVPPLTITVAGSLVDHVKVVSVRAEMVAVSEPAEYVPAAGGSTFSSTSSASHADFATAGVAARKPARRRERDVSARTAVRRASCGVMAVSVTRQARRRLGRGRGVE